MENLNNIKDQIFEALVLIDKVKNKVKEDEYEKLEIAASKLENCLILFECEGS